VKRKFCVLIILTVCLNAIAQLKLPRLASDHAVFQRDRVIKLAGQSAPNEEIQLTFNGRVFKSTADGKGKWLLEIPPQQAGGPFDMVFAATREQILIKDVLFGDVWICAGQSNMEMMVNNVKDKYPEVVATSANSHIRHFAVPQMYDFNSPHDDLAGGEWKTANPENVLRFSAAGYFFARELYEKYKVPIGLINASLGGSPAEAWMSEGALEEFPQHVAEAKKFRSHELITGIETADRTRISAWHAALAAKDAGIAGRWRNGHIDDSAWHTMQLPGYWSDKNVITGNGVVWFRRAFDIPSSMADAPARLNLGRVVDQDSVFINGEFAGTTGYQYPQRRYNLKPGMLKPGRNIIVVKVINQSGKGGFVADKPYQIIAAGDTVDLRGPWKYRLGASMEPLAGQTFIRWKPMGLYNAMVAPLVKFPIKGAIWYQGEANVSRPEEYRKLFPALIADWRAKWGDTFPFLFVQLPNFLEARETPSKSNWAALREAQSEALKLPLTGMVVAIDLGDWNDIHPLDKQSVGKRLALQAMKVAYGEHVPADGPSVSRARFAKTSVTIEFRNVNGGLVVKNGPAVGHVAISEDGKNFVWARTKVSRHRMRVWHESVTAPMEVRYAWADNPDSANLYNRSGLPASPFRVRK